MLGALVLISFSVELWHLCMSRLWPSDQDGHPASRSSPGIPPCATTRVVQLGGSVGLQSHEKLIAQRAYHLRQFTRASLRLSVPAVAFHQSRFTNHSPHLQF